MANGAIDNNPNRAPIRELVPDDLLLRALLKKAWLDSLHEAFMLRADEDGLSVCFDCAPEECIAILNLNRTYGVASLAVNGPVALGLTVTADEPHHAVIGGVPHKEQDPVRAEWLATQLAALSAIVDRTRRERAIP